MDNTNTHDNYGLNARARYEYKVMRDNVANPVMDDSWTLHAVYKDPTMFNTFMLVFRKLYIVGTLRDYDPATQPRPPENQVEVSDLDGVDREP